MSSLLAANESLRKDLLSKDSELVKLRKLLDERDRKLDEAVSFRATATRELDQLGRELQRAQKEVSILRADKASADAVHAENASYIKKLEARLTAGGKDFLLDQNLKLKASIDKLTVDNEQLAASNAGQKAELERAMREIEVLVSLPPLDAASSLSRSRCIARHLPCNISIFSVHLIRLTLQATALELRAEELQLHGDMRSGLLYEVANRREEARRLGAELSAARDRIAALEFESREATIRAERAEGDAAGAGARAASLDGRVAEMASSLSAMQAVSWSCH